MFEQRFIAQGNVSFNCRKGFGTRAAQMHAFECIRKATDNYRRKAWVYRGDIVSFFMSIDKRILWNKLEAFIKRNYSGSYLKVILTVTRIVVFHCPEKKCVFNSPVEEWADHVEREKSLFGVDDFHGMPIGNLTTQIFANFLMSFFDDFARSWFESRRFPFYYARFVDDFLVTCQSKAALKRFAKDACVYLHERFQLKVHRHKYHFQLASHGVMFVGVYLKNGRMYLSNRVLARFLERVYGFNEMLRNKSVITICDVLRMERVLNSYLGFCKGLHMYGLRHTLLSSFCPRFYEYFIIRNNYGCVNVRREMRLSA